MNTRIIWTTTNEIESTMIRWGLERDCSHVAIQFGDTIFHSYEGKVREELATSFLAKVQLIHSIELLDNLQLSLQLQAKLRKAIGGKKYDYSAIIYWAWRGLLFKLFNKRIPRKNLWQKNRHWYCVEIFDVIRYELEELLCVELSNIDFSMVDPHGLYDLLLEKESNK